MKARFKPDADPSASGPPLARLIDPEAYEASEQQFAVSLEEQPGGPKFVLVDEKAQNGSDNAQAGPQPEAAGNGNGVLAPETAAEKHNDEAQRATQGLGGDSGPAESDSWRQELAAKVGHYRARRRPRAPRYPSLQLRFGPADSSWHSHSVNSQSDAASAASRLATAMQDILPDPADDEQAFQPISEEMDAADTGGKILEFPCSVLAPPIAGDELAEPVFAYPRILEVPEVQPPPPALGGILIEAEEPATERRPGFELPLLAAPTSRRVLAAAIDGLIVLGGFALFGYTFLRITPIVLPLRQVVGISAALVAVLGAGYQYLLLVYAGTTPGLKLAKLQLSRFDGNPVPKAIRRWRVLASVLSGLSLALGYLWCFLDEDKLCWHDRITHTYMAPKSPK